MRHSMSDLTSPVLFQVVANDISAKAARIVLWNLTFSVVGAMKTHQTVREVPPPESSSIAVTARDPKT
ncbi:hypothetical protein K438DRAFT_1847694 [Mycena galopus ATCC 62051]|nr:hypothetical protein K438DRAFT_1847694 [Mycena galopus ATCC 62051]